MDQWRYYKVNEAPQSALKKPAANAWEQILECRYCRNKTILNNRQP
jgi:hypothetical protein